MPILEMTLDQFIKLGPDQTFDKIVERLDKENKNKKKPVKKAQGTDISPLETASEQ